ncbi:MAG TPA: transposase [Candidatus Latescibacteria bacterium]|nr:transposase [Candidatus Latescibacterota bacterium]HJP31087.1 transposase [Candidatus Latescibacterota bacterium]
MFAGQSVSVRCDVADGTCQILLSPQELLEKLAALVPPPRLNLVRYHGVLAPNATDRAQIVPGPPPARPGGDCGWSRCCHSRGWY